MQQPQTGIISPLIRYFREQNMSRDYTQFGADRAILVPLVIPPSYTWQSPIYFPPQSILDGDNCTITAISVSTPAQFDRTTEGVNNVSSRTTLKNAVLFISNLRREVIAELPLEMLAFDQGEVLIPNRPCLTHFDEQVWQNCYVQLTASGTYTNQAIMFTVYYRTKDKG
jgi:hypothetical protein